MKIRYLHTIGADFLTIGSSKNYTKKTDRPISSYLTANFCCNKKIAIDVMNTAHEQEHRRFTRVPFPAVVNLRADGRQWKCTVIDISLKGALLQSPADWHAKRGQDVNLDVAVAEGIHILMHGTVAHVEGGHVGVTCQHIDLDSAAHLRRLVELNLGDEAKLHRELQALILPE